MGRPSFPLLRLMLVAACAGCGASAEDAALGEPIARRSQPLFLYTEKVWSDPRISVCWEAFSQSTAEQRGWVQAAVESSFESVSAVDFTGWAECTSAGADVVVRVGNAETPLAQIGSRAASVEPSVWLNFGDAGWPGVACGADRFVGPTGRSWPTQHQWCIETFAVHEFAHVLSIAHEQERPDTPSALCEGTPVPGGDDAFGYWDLTSVSNYCNPALNNDGRLSPLDVAGVQVSYGQDENAMFWYGLGNVRNYGRAPIDQVNFAIAGQRVPSGALPLTGDFDGDAATDVYWYDPMGPDPIWWSNGNGSFTAGSRPLSSGYLPFAGDFNGDGCDDIFLYSPTGIDGILWGHPSRTFTSTAFDAFGPGYFPVVGDFDGDGRDDIFWYSPTGVDKLWWSNGDSSFTSVNRPLRSGFAPFAGDFDGDGDDDLFWYNPTGASFILESQGRSRSFITHSIHVDGQYTPAIGDFDGDGIDDILWNGWGGTTDQLWLMRRPFGTKVVTNIEVARSQSVARPALAGDFNRDGFGDILWYSGE